MGCFFACFGIKESRSNPISSPKPAVPRSKNALSSLFTSDDETLLKAEEGRNQVLRQLDVKELNEEVKFVKSYGALLKTEIRKDLEKENGIPERCGQEKSSELSSWFSNASTENSKQEKQGENSSIAVKNREDRVAGSGSLVDSPSRHNTGSSCQRSVQNAITPSTMQGNEMCSETSSMSPLPFMPSVKSPTKSVHFVCASNRSGFSSEGSSSECVSPYPKQSGDEIVTKPCLYPTPLKLTSEMQASGTESPVYIDDASSSKCMDLRDESSSDNFRESVKLDDEETLIATPMLGSASKHHLIGEETEDEGSLSSWFKPVSVSQNKRLNSVSAEKVSVKTPGDRPILGMVAAYWNEDETTSQISPKWWDGNGIPNSTNKYKEDQKVSWHATPFEERLEKALSEETSITQRKPVGSAPPVNFNETEESDTALSRLQSSSHTKPVFSF